MSQYEPYLNSDYALSFDEQYTPTRFEVSKGLILRREIQGSNLYDAMGCYPLFFCEDWPSLQIDIENNDLDLISLTVVTDPFGEYDDALLGNCFNSLVVPFKKHFVADLSKDPEEFINKHNLRYAKKAIEAVSVEVTNNPIDLSDIWVEMYRNLVIRHSINGIAAFSEETLRRHLNISGAIIIAARHGSQVVGITVWYVQNNIAYYHLGAYSDVGYKLRASYAIFPKAIEHFQKKGIAWLNIGAGAGIQNNGNDGLSRFKKGWSTGTKTAFLCGHIFDYESYNKLARVRGTLHSSYFPAYREGEFN
jgi:hypothetical protein